MTALTDKLERLKNIISEYGQMMVALSGGVDSVFLLVFAYSIWHDGRISALTARGPHFAEDEILYAKQLCNRLSVHHEFADVSDILPAIEDNPRDRCYICKKAIFSSLKERADMEGRVLADGTNLDDMDDYRPGYRALQELDIANPLKDAGLTKADIRAALRELAAGDKKIGEALDVDIWNKPAFACLASRIPYGSRITEEKLKSVYDAEVFLRSEGFAQVRVRHHGDVARIEVLPEDRIRFCNADFMDKVDQKLKACGFKFVALDLGGYKMGNLNY